MPVKANPFIVWQRIRTDVYRLGEWAKATGDQEYIDAAETCVAALNKLTIFNELTPITYIKAPITNGKTAPKPEHVVDKLSPTEKAEIQQAARDAFDIGDYTNPYTDSHLRSRAWSQAQNDYHASLQENQGDAEPELP